jgi:hypothetical protein
VPVAGNYPTRFTKREAKVIECALSAAGTLTAKTITSSTIGVTNTVSLYDSLFSLADNTTPTKLLAFQLASKAAGTTTFNVLGTANTLTFPAGTGTVALTTDIGADVRATATVALTAAQIANIKATPIQIVAAPAAGSAIIVEHIELLHTYAVAQYNGGGVCKLQYKNTASGGGVVLGPDLNTIVKAGSTSNSMWSVANSAVDMADVTAQGIFLSTDTAEFGAGDAGNVLKFRISYRVVVVVA